MEEAPEEEKKEEKKENGNGDAPANGTAVCTMGDFPTGLERLLSLYYSLWCRCWATRSRPTLCPAAVQVVLLFGFVNFHR